MWVKVADNEHVPDLTPVIKINGVRYKEVEERKIITDPQVGTETATYIIDDKDEYWDYETICKACEGTFIAYDKDGNTVRNYCPCCGAKLE